MQWAKKNTNIINFLLNRLDRVNKNEKETNIILLQFIPIIETLSNDQKKKLFDIIISNILPYPSSILRNKALTIISLLPPDLIFLNKQYLGLVRRISTTKQLNSSYPAKKILEMKRA